MSHTQSETTLGTAYVLNVAQRQLAVLTLPNSEYEQPALL